MKKLLHLVLLVVAAAMCFSLGFAFRDLSKGRMPTAEPISRLLGPKAKAPQATATQVFKHTFNKILRDYYKPVDAAELKYAAMQGVMGALGDPHTVFMEPKGTKEFMKETSGNIDFVGVGARLLPDELGARVMTVFKSGPASRSGVMPGDLVVGVNGKAVAGLEIDKIVSQIRGPEGTEVTLNLVRAGGAKVELKMRRAKVIAPTVDGFVVDGTDIGYLMIAQFSENSVAQFDTVVQDLEAKKIGGLVIDLRNNPGGRLETAVELLSRFVADKLVVKMKFRDGKEQVERTYGDQLHAFGYPVVLLLNEDSASAAEIFGGVLKDYGLATLVGDHTYGKASVQNVWFLSDGSSAKVTIAHYFLPNGKDIARRVDEEGQYLSGGIKPDVEVALSLAPGTVFGDIRFDNQLQKAIEVIKNKRQ